MAQQTVITLVDDLDQKPIADGDGETVSFTYRGQGYEIDLSNKHLETLDNFLEKYISVARKVGGSVTPIRKNAAAAKQRPSNDADPKAVRAWAEANGVQVNARGRLSAEVIEQYKAANG